MKNPKSIRSLFNFSGFTATSTLKGVFGDRYSRVITLRRQKKQQSVLGVGSGVPPDTIVKLFECVIYLPLVGASFLSLNVGELNVPGANQCT